MAIAAIGQICSTASVPHNLAQCCALVTKAASLGAKALFLPEASDYIAFDAAETIRLARPVADNSFVKGLQAAAKERKLEINVGIHEPAHNGRKVENTLIWIDAQGEIVQQYRKLHLFDAEIPGGPVLKESNSVEKGMEIVKPFETMVGRVGMAICYDLRFPEMSLSLRRQGAQIITFPSAFTPHTGNAHWEVLLRARAIETQSYIVAAAQVGEHNGKRASYGHSMIVDPWGTVVASLKGEEDVGKVVTAEIDVMAMEKVRQEMPLLRRTDVYSEV